MKNLLFSILTVAIVFQFCTPKTGEEISETQESQNEEMVEATNQEFRSNAPEPTAATAVKTGEYSSFKLDNGLKVIVVENHKIPRVSYSLRIDREPILEEEKAGYIQLAGSLITAGTENRTKAEIDEAIDFIGANLSSGSTSLYGSALTKHQDELLDVMTDVLYNATFPEEEFEKEKKKLLSGLASSKTNPNAIARNISGQVLYGKDHPYGEITTEETVENITIDDIRSYYQKFFAPNISYLVIVGDISEDKAKKVAQNRFGKWEKKDIESPAVPEVKMNDSRKVYFVDKPGAVQSVIRVVNPIMLKPGDDMEIAANVANSILGGGVFSGYLMQNLREDKAYTYGARSSLSPDEYVGSFSAYASVRNEVTDSSVVEFLRELNRIKNEEVSTDHLNLTLNSMSGAYARSLESPQTIANQAYRIEKYNLPEDYYDTYLQKLENVSKEDVQKAAKKYIKPNTASIVVVGNKDDVASKLSRFAGNNEVIFLTPEGKTVTENENPIPTGVTVQSIYDKYIESLGGEEAINNIETVKWKMQTEVQGMTIKSERVMKLPDHLYEVQKMQGNILSKKVYNGEAAQVQSPQGGSRITDKKDLEEFVLDAKIVPEMHYEALGYTSTLKSMEKVNDKEHYKVEVETPSGDKLYNYYDAVTGLKTQQISSQKAQQRTISITTSFKSYKPMSGVKFPTLIVVEGAMPMPLELNTTGIEINEEVDEALFEIK